MHCFARERRRGALNAGWGKQRAAPPKPSKPPKPFGQVNIEHTHAACAHKGAERCARERPSESHFKMFVCSTADNNNHHNAAAAGNAEKSNKVSLLYCANQLLAYRGRPALKVRRAASPELSLSLSLFLSRFLASLLALSARLDCLAGWQSAFSLAFSLSLSLTGATKTLADSPARRAAR